ncbi:MAG: sensor histidine kinase [Nocardiopsaceae bacterium]|nr:sensor histidine kinase [Nocardiopsaceae bacterium]
MGAIPHVIRVAVAYRQRVARKDSGRSVRRGTVWPTILRVETRVFAVLGLFMLLIWIAGDNPYFWPVWVWFGLAIPLAFQYAIRHGRRAPKGHRLLAVHSAITCVIAGMLLVIWFLVGLGPGAFWPFWPVWPILALSVLLVTHAWIRHSFASARERALADRVEVLTRTRRGALDVQAAELQRIERDLHDGAQARLVSVAMSLGLAEELLTQDPDTLSGLIAEARSSTLTALDDLRTVMRGIQPPVLADRGLEGALRALALDLAVPVTVHSDLSGRVPAPVESAAYFAACECLANVVKHSGARQARVDLGYRDGVLSVVVTDDGSGGAAMESGSGLRGVVRRLEVFDGRVALTSPAGGPTVVRMEVPCELSSPRI